MKKTLKSPEVSIGLMIFIMSFVLLYFSSLSVSMKFTHQIIIEVAALLFVALLMNLRIISNIPREGKLRPITRDDYMFELVNRKLFFFIFFALFTIMAGILADIIETDRTQNILLASMLITTFYNVALSIWYTFSYMDLSISNERDNPIHKNVLMGEDDDI